jgi:hypothetical protein
MKAQAILFALIAGVAGAAAAADKYAPPIKDPWEALRQGRGDEVEAGWRPAAQAGDLQAQLFLGHLAIMRGRHKDAVPWYLMAAQQGNPEAQTLLATQYLRGEGVARDPVLAYALYDLAARQGFANAGEARDTAARQMSPNQIQEAQSLVARWGSEGVPSKLEPPENAATR